jgi:superfamily II DNA/RNA helicase
MTKEEYISELQADLQASVDDYRYNNHKNQIFARKLSAQFTPTYDESLLWSRALYISSNACVLLLENQNAKLAINSLRDAAEVYENIGLIAQSYDKQYAMVLSSLCYDLAGYQANARCLVRQVGVYSFESKDNWENIDSINYILSQVCCILLKQLPSAQLLIKEELEHDLGIKLFNRAIAAWYDHALDGRPTNYLDLIRDAYRYYLNASNVVVSHLLFLLRARLTTYSQRSIWQNLSAFDFIGGNAQWIKYIKLLTHDYYDRDKIKQVERRVSKFEFWTSQLRAIEAGLLDSDSNFIIQMPTSAGKTFIAELAITNSLIRNPGKKCIYISPFRALTNEKETELSEYLSKLGYSVSALSGSYEVDEFQNIILEDTDILVATPEKIDLLLRVNPAYFESVALLVFDEGHIVGDISARSSLMEFLIIRLRIKIPTVRILFISAVMPPENANEYSMWLNERNDRVIRSLLHADSAAGEEWEPTRKLLGAFTWDRDNGRIGFRTVETEDEQSRIRTGAFIPALIRAKQYGETFPDKTNKAQTSVAIAYELSKQGNCLVFCAQARETLRVGKSMLELLAIIDEQGTPAPEHFLFNTDRESYYFARKWFGETHIITRCLQRGVGIHYGDLPEPVRRGVESDYASGNLRILISTNTVGQGLNFPIKYLIIHSTLIMPTNPVSVRDFWNIVGRAGRAGKETEGQVIFNIKSPTDRRAYERYTDKTNIEKAYSIFFNVLSWLTDFRINQEAFIHNLQILSEPYLLSLLVEETVETSDEVVVERIIDASLFKVQALAQEVDLQPLRNSFRQILGRVRSEVPDEMREAFAETGLILKSNLAIAAHIDGKLDALSVMVEEDNYFELLTEIFSLFDSGDVEEMSSDKLSRLQLRPSETIGIARS